MLKNKIVLILLIIIALPFTMLCQDNENYQFVQSANPEMKRKLIANELMFDKQEKYLIVNYGNKPTYIIVYEWNTWKAIANFRLSNWVEFTGAYVDYESNQLYIKEGRYSKEYHRLDITNGQTDIVDCKLTPGGCPVIEPMQSEKAIYSNDNKIFVTINKRNTRDVRIYKLKE